MDLDDVIRERRKLLGLTQEDLSDMTGVSLRTLKEIEMGRGNPTLRTLEKLALVLGLEIQLTVRKTAEQ